MHNHKLIAGLNDGRSVHRSVSRAGGMQVLYRAGESEWWELSREDFEGLFDVKWTDTLIVGSSVNRRRLREALEKDRQFFEQPSQGRFSARYERNRKLVERFGKKIEERYLTDMYLAHINERIGYGAFANRLIQPGEMIGEYVGVISDVKSKTSNRYLFTYHPRVHYPESYLTGLDIDPEKNGNLTRFINHSDNPNIKIADVFYNGLWHVLLIASKHIRRDEQLCYDYGEEYWQSLGETVLPDAGCITPIITHQNK